jgi:heme exporter protein D
MRNLDFTSWQALLSTLLGLAVITLIGVGIRLVVMQTIQQRRERENRQINERLRTLIAAYKTLGGSFTGNLAVDPVHLRDLLRRAETDRTEKNASDATAESSMATGEWPSSDRSRRIRDAVEAALSDIVLLGTDEQVTLAAQAAADLVAGRPVQTGDLVVSLRNFIREVLDLNPISPDLPIPRQGPARITGARGSGKGDGGAKEGGKEGGGKAMAGDAAMGGGVGLGLGAGLGAEEEHDSHR